MTADIEQVPRQTRLTHLFSFYVYLFRWYGKCWWLAPLCFSASTAPWLKLPVLVELWADVFHPSSFLCLLLLSGFLPGNDLLVATLSHPCGSQQKLWSSSETCSEQQRDLRVLRRLFIQPCSLIAGHEAMICFRDLVCEIPKCCFFSPFHFPFKCQIL